MSHKAFNFVVIGLVGVLLGEPIAACITPGHSMTAVEHACCIKMASMCGRPAMPTSHSCCKQAVSLQVVALSKVPRADIVAPVITASEIAPTLPPFLRSLDLHDSASPPGSPPKFSTVLRI